MPWFNKFPDLKNDPAYLEPRVTSVETQLAEKTKDSYTRAINVKYPPVPMVGAKGAGFTDDTVVLQNIIDYCGDNNYNVFFPPSDLNKMFYKITAKLVVRDDVSIFGVKGNGGYECESTIRTTAFDQDIFEVRGNVVEIKDLTLVTADPTGHFGCLEHFSSTIRTSSTINFVYGNDPKVEGIWFSQYGARCVTRSDSVQGGIWTNNVVDGAQHGFYGNLKYNLMSNNRFYGITQRAVYATYATNTLMIGNFFDSCNIGLELYNPNLLEADKSGNIDNVLFNGNIFVGTTETPLKLTGVTNSSFTNNRLGRTGSHAVQLSNCSRSIFKNIAIGGIGDFYYSNTSAYFYLDGFNTDHEFGDITVKYSNPTQKADYIFKFTAGNETNYNKNIYRNNHFNITGSSMLGICNVGEHLD